MHQSPLHVLGSPLLSLFGSGCMGGFVQCSLLVKDLFFLINLGRISARSALNNGIPMVKATFDLTRKSPGYREVRIIQFHNCHSQVCMQASNLTSGVYVNIKKPEALFQQLLPFSASLRTREFMELPTANEIRFKGSCFCHIRHVDVGYVCSACLAVYCAPHDRCSTCGSDCSGTVASYTGL